ncbi:hypothetical protein J1N35_015598 [Gossypium stocksii]|uniref:Uncharacterized protein n=1 Tax=Gossypium stocksii TaxID=47602 RepID=A0A9D4AAZ6_9ROSI|nr:hypothetical protein J1N35_015598 [Gossypium stocksii]
MTNEKVSKDSCGEIRLQYVPEERWFKLINKGKNLDDPSPPAFKSKQGKGSMGFKPQPTHLNVIGENAEYLVIEGTPHLDLSKHHSLIVDDYVLKSGMKNLTIDEYCNDKFVDVIRGQ